MSITREAEKSMRAAEDLVDFLSTPVVAAMLLGIFAVALAILA